MKPKLLLSAAALLCSQFFFAQEKAITVDSTAVITLANDQAALEKAQKKLEKDQAAFEKRQKKILSAEKDVVKASDKLEKARKRLEKDSAKLERNMSKDKLTESEIADANNRLTKQRAKIKDLEEKLRDEESGLRKARD
jgi:predicted  nucleic acid-binding Zn-ribbon protein